MESMSGGHDGLRLRPATKEDQENIFQLRKQFKDAFLTPQRLADHLQSLNLERQTRVIESSEGGLIGYGELLQRKAGWFTPKIWVHPNYQRSGTGQELLQALEVCALSISEEPSLTMLAQPEGDGVVVDRFLEKMGYFLHTTYEIRELIMHAAPPNPVPSPGIEIRSFVLEHDAQKAFEADNEAFLDQRGYVSRTFEEWSQRFHMHTDHFDPTLWLVAWDGERVAGGVYNQIVDGIGEVMHLGVRRPFRKRGIGTALMRYSLAEYYRRGVSTVHLNVDANSLTNAHLLYESLGFKVKSTYRNYMHEISR